MEGIKSGFWDLDSLRKQSNPLAMSIKVNLVRHFEMLVCYVSFLSRKWGMWCNGSHVIRKSLYHHGNLVPYCDKKAHIIFVMFNMHRSKSHG